MDKKLYRSQTDKRIAGVCGGLAEYLGVDATVIRIIALLLLLPGGFPGFLPYVILWLVIPLDPSNDAGNGPSAPKSDV